MRRFIFLAAVLLLAMAAPGARAADHKGGAWFLDADDEFSFCMGGTRAKDGQGLLTLVGSRGAITVAVTPAKKVRRGTVGVIATDAGDIAFVPEIGKDNFIVAARDLEASEIATLSRAKVIRVIIDGAVVLEAAVENSGIEDVLAGAVACSNGEAGWWGKGVGAPASKPPVNKEDVWFLERAAVGQTQVCTAYALADERTMLLFIGADGYIGMGVKSEDDLPRGRQGLVEADERRIAFKPVFDGKRYFASDESIDGGELHAVRNAKELRVSVDGRPVVDVRVANTGLPALLDDLAACSRGERGWWGEGAKQKP
jgi:hypothetical protein